LEHDTHKIKEELKKHESEYSSLKRKLSILKSNPEVLDFLQKSKDNEEVQKKEKQLLKLHKTISDFKRKRTREVNRKNKLITLLTELRSLNNHMEIGNITCSTCGSDKIIYRAENFEFDVSNQYVRKSIIDSINEDIELKSEIIIELTNNINKQQDLIDKELKSTPTDIKNILIFKDEVISVSSLDTEARKLQKIIKNSKDQIKNKDSNTKLAKIKMDELENTLVDNMNSYYQEINSDGNLRFGSLFTKKDQTYSGSEEQEFYFCKVMSIKDHFNLPFPILVDSFRDGELSTAKEDKMLDILQSTSGQIILTSTLKSE
ncbi:hypothetical protein L1D34_29525, partial [Vibrio mediterranei]|nr:hypothetical protein [Vibrio mediterranei]